MEEGSIDPDPLLCPAPLLLVSPGGEEVGLEEGWGWLGGSRGGGGVGLVRFG